MNGEDNNHTEVRVREAANLLLENRFSNSLHQSGGDFVSDLSSRRVTDAIIRHYTYGILGDRKGRKEEKCT